MALSTVEVLKAARKLITPEGAWTQGEYARKLNKIPTSYDNPAALCWCSSGALLKVSQGTRLMGAARKSLELFTEGSIWQFNDAHSHAEVLAAFDRAIAAEEARNA